MAVLIFAGERQTLPEVLPTANAWMSLCPASDAELVQLLKIVRAAVPRIVPLNDEQMAAIDVSLFKLAKPEAQRVLMPFKVAFTYCHCSGRTEKPDRRFFVGHWGGACEEWARQHYAPRTNVQEFTFAAVIANADIPYCLRTLDWEPAIGLVDYNGGRRAGTTAVPSLRGDGIEYIRCEFAWREVLAGTRQLRAPESPAPVERDPTTISHRHRFDHPRRWQDIEPYDPA